MKVQLLWIDTCPNSQHTLELLSKVLREENIVAPVESIQVCDQEEAVAKKFLGSPTIRLDGEDPFTEPGQTQYAMQCRIYRTPEGMRGAPTEAMIRQAIRAKGSRKEW